jgi:pre-mRNA-splicing factor SYF1
VEDLASIYCAWAEMELRHEEYDKALQVMQHAITEPSQAIQRRRAAEAQGRALAGSGRGKGKEQQEMQAAIPVQVRWCLWVGWWLGIRRDVDLTNDIKNHNNTTKQQERVHRSTRVWTLYLDLEESLGTLATTKAAYDRCLELKVRKGKGWHGWCGLVGRKWERGTDPYIVTHTHPHKNRWQHRRSCSTTRRFWRSTPTSR